MGCFGQFEAQAVRAQVQAQASRHGLPLLRWLRVRLSMWLPMPLPTRWVTPLRLPSCRGLPSSLALLLPVVASGAWAAEGPLQEAASLESPLRMAQASGTQPSATSNATSSATPSDAALGKPASTQPNPGQPEARPRPEIEGAVGLIFRYNAVYPGAQDYSGRVRPAGYLRWGRYTMTGSGGFTTLRSEDIERGLGARLLDKNGWHLGAGVRVASGRGESDSVALSGMGTIRQTVRGRLALRWDINPDWRAGAGLSLDLLARGVGTLADIHLSRRWRLDDGATLTLGGALNAGDARYMQLWHGVNATQALNSGYAPFAAQAGLREAQLGATWRAELNAHWTGFVTVGASKLLGSAADSPLTRRAEAWSWASGLAWRF